MAYGQVNADVIGTSVAGSNLGAGNASAMKNRIINGDMRIDQRNAGASVTPTTTAYPWPYNVDRWDTVQTQASKFSVQQNAGAVTPPVGFTKYLGFTSLSSYSPISTDVFVLQQRIEGFNIADLGWGTANAKTITVSFWVRSSLTGNFGGSINNANDNRWYAFSYAISAANTWEQKTVTLVGDTTGTWGSTNGIGLNLNFSLGMGSASLGTAGTWTGTTTIAPTGSTNLVGTSGATFYITGVQLEVGSSATGFEYRQYGTELQLCQRYAMPCGQGAYGRNYNTTSTELGFNWQQQMRASPTLTFGGFSGASTRADQYGISSITLTSLSSYVANSYGSYVNPITSGATTGAPVAISFGNVFFASAEL